MDKMIFGKFISDARRELGMTQQMLADRLHVTDKAVSKWERGCSYPDLTLMEDLAAALGMSTAELIACRREPAMTADTEVKNLMAIVKEQKGLHQKQLRRAFTVLLTAVILIAGITALYIFRTEVYSGHADIMGTQERGEERLVYIETENDTQLIVLSCPDRSLFEVVSSNNRTDCKLTYRWSPYTCKGTLLRFELDPNIEIPMRLTDTVGSVGSVGELFGIECMLRIIHSVHPDSDREGEFLFTFSYYYEGDGSKDHWEELQSQTHVLTVKNCKDVAQGDFDSDGKSELLVLTRYENAPYQLYDLVDGLIVRTFVDEVPNMDRLQFQYSDFRK